MNWTQYREHFFELAGNFRCLRAEYVALKYKEDYFRQEYPEKFLVATMIRELADLNWKTQFEDYLTSKALSPSRASESFQEFQESLNEENWSLATPVLGNLMNEIKSDPIIVELLRIEDQMILVYSQLKAAACQVKNFISLMSRKIPDRYRQIIEEEENLRNPVGPYTPDNSLYWDILYTMHLKKLIEGDSDDELGGKLDRILKDLLFERKLELYKYLD